MPNVLITGASGFIGSFIVSEGLAKGYNVWAAVRPSSSRAYLQDERIHFANITLSDKDTLRQELRSLGVRFDYVIHAAGATKCLDFNDFYRTNTQGTINLVEALREEGMTPRRFVFVSSLSIFGAIHEEQPYTPILPTDTPQPNTLYGKSKLAAEEYLRSLDVNEFPYTILRPTGVYGPREKDYFVMAKSISQHIDFAVGYRKQDITFVYVLDVVQAIYKVLDNQQSLGKAYFLSDGEVYNSRTFSDLLQEELGNPWVLHITAPLWLLRIICIIGGFIGKITHRLIVLNRDKYNILAQRNWQCDISDAQRDFGYSPQWTLARGVRASVEWYHQAKWL